jgi:hypothetical protein
MLEYDLHIRYKVIKNYIFSWAVNGKGIRWEDPKLSAQIMEHYCHTRPGGKNLSHPIGMKDVYCTNSLNEDDLQWKMASNVKY